MKKIILTIFILNISLLFSEGQKIGYVNTQSIFAQNEDARLAHADVEKEAKRLQVEYENKAMTLDSLMRDYQKLELMLTDDMKAERQQAMQSLNAELENFQMKYFGQPDGEIFLMLQERMAPINALMQSAIDKVAAENSYDYILDVSQGIVLYKLDSFDLTELVIEKLNKMSIDNSNIQEFIGKLKSISILFLFIRSFHRNINIISLRLS